MCRSSDIHRIADTCRGWRRFVARWFDRLMEVKRMDGLGPEDEATARRLLFDEAVDGASAVCDPAHDFSGFRVELWRRLAGAYGWPTDDHPDSVLARITAEGSGR